MGIQYSPSTATRGSTSNSLLRPDQNHSEEDESMHSDDEIPNYGMLNKYNSFIDSLLNLSILNLFSFKSYILYIFSQCSFPK